MKRIIILAFTLTYFSGLIGQFAADNGIDRKEWDNNGKYYRTLTGAELAVCYGYQDGPGTENHSLNEGF